MFYDEEGELTIATLERAFDGFHHIDSVAGRKGIVTVIDEDELPGLYRSGKLSAEWIARPPNRRRAQSDRAKARQPSGRASLSNTRLVAFLLAWSTIINEMNINPQ
jgi:hypothetical protein